MISERIMDTIRRAVPVSKACTPTVGTSWRQVYRRSGLYGPERTGRNSKTRRTAASGVKGNPGLAACVGTSGLGLMCGVEFVQDKAGALPPGRGGRRVMDACLDRGLIVFPGRHGGRAAGDHLLLRPRSSRRAVKQMWRSWRVLRRLLSPSPPEFNCKPQIRLSL
jgi:hypothetical protein